MATIRNATMAQVVRATGIVSRRPVVSCPSPADAASPVTLHRGNYSQQIGQAADWRHRTEEAARQHEAELVEGYYHDGVWTVETTADGDAVTALIRQWDAEDAAKRAKERAAREAAECTPAAVDARHQAMRREIGLPDGVLPHIRLCRVNGSVGVMLPDGRTHFGGFTVDAATGEVVVQ